MLAVAMRGYSIVFEAQLSCKTFYWTDVYNEESCRLMQPR